MRAGETLHDTPIDVTNIFVGATASVNYLSFKETLDPELCNRPDTDDPLDRARSRLMRPTPPEQLAKEQQLRRRNYLLWHRREAAENEKNGNGFAAGFHLGRSSCAGVHGNALRRCEGPEARTAS